MDEKFETNLEEKDKIDEQMIACLSLDELNEEQMCYSFESQTGWIAVSTLVDSGASDSVAPPGTFPGVNVFETNASRAGLEYTAAGGHKIANLGMCKPIVQTLDGHQYAMGFQIAGVSKPLGAVSRIVGQNNEVIFRHPARGGSCIRNLDTQHEVPLRQSNGVYYLDVWMKPGNEVKSQDFTRPAK